jgi:pseudouridine synthase
MKIRLQKIISRSGFASRRQAERLIAEGRVRVNGAVVTQLGTLADPREDAIRVRGKPLPSRRENVYLILNKPTGCLTTVQDDRGRPTVMACLKKVPVRVFPVGRLDYNTQGILLFTNDGVLARELLDPKNRVPRTYLVKVRGVPDEKALSRLKKGVFLQNRPTAPIEVKVERVSGKNCFLTMVLTEGKNRHVKNVCETIGHPVIRLKRTHFAFLGLDDLELGEFRYLTDREVACLHKLVHPGAKIPERETRARRRKRALEKNRDEPGFRN